MTYTIAIDELQRSIIENALRAFAAPGTAVFDDTPEDEAKYLRDAFTNMPAVEAQTPGILHGICL